MEDSLLKAVNRNDVRGVERLIVEGASVNARSPSSSTLLHAAAGRGSGEIAAFLAAHGADVRALDSDGNTALHLAVWSGNERAAAALVAMGSDIHARNFEGGTPLYFARLRGSPEIAATLLREVASRAAEAEADDGSMSLAESDSETEEDDEDDDDEQRQPKAPTPPRESGAVRALREELGSACAEVDLLRAEVEEVRVTSAAAARRARANATRQMEEAHRHTASMRAAHQREVQSLRAQLLELEQQLDLQRRASPKQSSPASDDGWGDARAKAAALVAAEEEEVEEEGEDVSVDDPLLDSVSIGSSDEDYDRAAAAASQALALARARSRTAVRAATASSVARAAAAAAQDGAADAMRIVRAAATVAREQKRGRQSSPITSRSYAQHDDAEVILDLLREGDESSSLENERRGNTAEPARRRAKPSAAPKAAAGAGGITAERDIRAFQNISNAPLRVVLRETWANDGGDGDEDSDESRLVPEEQPLMPGQIVCVDASLTEERRVVVRQSGGRSTSSRVGRFKLLSSVAHAHGHGMGGWVLDSDPQTGERMLLEVRVPRGVDDLAATASDCAPVVRPHVPDAMRFAADDALRRDAAQASFALPPTTAVPLQQRGHVQLSSEGEDDDDELELELRRELNRAAAEAAPATAATNTNTETVRAASDRKATTAAERFRRRREEKKGASSSDDAGSASTSPSSSAAAKRPSPARRSAWFAPKAVFSGLRLRAAARKEKKLAARRTPPRSDPRAEVPRRSSSSSSAFADAQATSAPRNNPTLETNMNAKQKKKKKKKKKKKRKEKEMKTKTKGDDGERGGAVAEAKRDSSWLWGSGVDSTMRGSSRGAAEGGAAASPWLAYADPQPPARSSKRRTRQWPGQRNKPAPQSYDAYMGASFLDEE